MTPNSDKKPDNNKKPETENDKVDYQIPKTIEEQITLAKTELDQFERNCSAQINFRRGRIDAMEMVRDGKPLVTKAPN